MVLQDRTLTGVIRLIIPPEQLSSKPAMAPIFLSGQMLLFSTLTGFRTISGKSETDYEAGKYNTEVIKENVSLSVLNAYLQVLFAEEQVKNSTNQISSTAEQLNLAEERMKLGAIANSDYLLVKSQLANENLTLATAQSQLAINRVTLMQFMELSSYRRL